MATAQKEQKAATEGTALVEADEFSTLLKQNFKPRTERAASEVESARTEWFETASFVRITP